MDRIMQDDSNYIYRGLKTTTDQPAKQTEYYNVGGQLLEADNQIDVVAKKIYYSSNNDPKYFIKVGTYGKIFNPIGMYSEGQNNKFLAKIGRKQFEFKEVNLRVFDLYLKFLTSKNLAWLNNAEREMN